MIGNLDSRKLKLIQRITSLSSDSELQKLEAYVRSLGKVDETHEVFKSVREDVSIKDLKEEQNIKGFDRKDFDLLANKLDIQEPLAQLIEMI